MRSPISPLILSARRTGNTTRQVDAAIQELFMTGKTEIIDHAHEEFFGTQVNRAQDNLLKILFTRLQMEHNISLSTIDYNPKTKILKLK